MAVSDIRERLEAKLDELDEAQLSALLRYAEAMESTSLPDDEVESAKWRYAEAMQSTTLPNDYDETNDPAIGFLSASADFASRTKEILEEGFGRSQTST